MAASTSEEYFEFPPVMNVHGHWGRLKTLDLCGATKDDVLCTIETHTGYSGSSPLGTRPGFYLHRGTSKSGPLLGAGGKEAIETSTALLFHGTSIIMLPPVDLKEARIRASSAMTTEFMRASIDRSPAADSGKQQVVTFSFAIEVGKGKRRETFAWKKIRKNDKDIPSKHGGFKLVRLSSGTSTVDDNETVAVLLWEKMAWIGWTHVCSLQLTGSGKLGVLGRRWSLMTVLTALQIYALKVAGQTTTGVVGIGEKLFRDDD